MRILFVTPHPPSEVRVRPYHFVRELVERGHELTLATTWANVNEQQDIAALRVRGHKVVARPLGSSRKVLNLARASLTGLPLQARYAWQPDLAATLQRVVRSAEADGHPFDVVHCEHLRGAAYGLHLRDLVPVVWDSVDSITYLFEQARRHTRSLRGRLMVAFDLERTRRYEGWLVGRFEKALVTSEADRQALIELAQAGPVQMAPVQMAPAQTVPAAPDPFLLPRPTGRAPGLANGNGHVPVLPIPPMAGAGRVEWSEAGVDASRQWRSIAVIPNGVDLAHFAPPTGPRDPETVLMTGKMSYHANVTAARFLVEEVMPLVWAQRPAARVVLAGAYPAREVHALAEADPTRIELTGYVPDLRLYFHRATVAVAPIIYGVGIQNKVLEAMATATPVVATPPAVRALAIQPGQDVLVAEGAAGLARAILDMFDDPARAASIGTAGRAYVECAHRWDDMVARLEAVYNELLHCSRARGG